MLASSALFTESSFKNKKCYVTFHNVCLSRGIQFFARRGLIALPERNNQLICICFVYAKFSSFF